MSPKTLFKENCVDFTNNCVKSSTIPLCFSTMKEDLCSTNKCSSVGHLPGDVLHYPIIQVYEPVFDGFWLENSGNGMYFLKITNEFILVGGGRLKRNVGGRSKLRVRRRESGG